LAEGFLQGGVPARDEPIERYGDIYGHVRHSGLLGLGGRMSSSPLEIGRSEEQKLIGAGRQRSVFLSVRNRLTQ
jgi:hypothetical protein